MDTQDILKKVRKIEIKTRGLSQNIFAGQYHSAFKGLGMGVIGSRFLLFYIKLAKHCQRGTSTSSFFLAWELGITLGIALGFVLQDSACQHLPGEHSVIFNSTIHELLYPGMILTGLSLILYNFLVHPWYMKHRNR